MFSEITNDKSNKITMPNNWKQHKAEHLKLSAVAASKYDELYEQANFATGSYMRYELDTIKRFINMSPSNYLALDLGCGTGRDSFYLAKQFQQVVGYDFSPEMILVANKNKLHRRVGNVLFEVKDIEEEQLPFEKNSIPFVNTAFGMASFVNNLESMFREVRRVLQPNGISIFSFYNSEALVNKLQLQWKPALAARVVEGEDCLEVKFEDNNYKISAKAYSVNDVKKRLEGAFGINHVIEITTFPTLSALFPQELFTDDTTRELCTKVDQMLANNLDIAAGPYIIAVCKKGGNTEKEKAVKGYEQVLKLLRQHNIDISIRVKEHEPVRTMEDVKKILDAEPNTMVKSVLIAFDEGKNSQIVTSNLFLIAVPADRKIDLSKIAVIIGVGRRALRMATQLEVEELTGFKVGSIPPFGLPKNIPVIFDERLLQHKEVWCGTGKVTESLKIKMDELKVLSTYTSFDVSKPTE